MSEELLCKPFKENEKTILGAFKRQECNGQTNLPENRNTISQQ